MHIACSAVAHAHAQKTPVVPCNGLFVVIFLKAVYNKTVNRFGFCDARNNQGFKKCYQSWSSALLLLVFSATPFKIDKKKSKPFNR